MVMLRLSKTFVRDHGADLSLTDGVNLTVLARATWRKQPKVACSLVQEGQTRRRDESIRGRENVMHQISEWISRRNANQGDQDTTLPSILGSWLADRGTDGWQENDTSQWCYAILCVFARAGRLVTALPLLGVTDVDFTVVEGFTPLNFLAKDGDLGAVNQLLKAGADPNASVGFDGLTALQAAPLSGRLAVVNRLLEAGADVNADPAKKTRPHCPPSRCKIRQPRGGQPTPRGESRCKRRSC
ncbi:hypothetical protein F5Y17DRAFT_449588 [Xylariaceae sp. FL0594]|nr:hypothetical protein F5Y17DRAFT_449588 [Xylariaceae sp. FL0594]